jgi:argininosuccinate synthase
VTQERVTGSVSFKLYKGNVSVAGRASDHALYDERFVTFGEDEVYQQSDAAGFIRLFGLSQRVRALKDQELAARSAEQPVPAEAATEIVEDAPSDVTLAVA